MAYLKVLSKHGTIDNGPVPNAVSINVASGNRFLYTRSILILMLVLTGVFGAPSAGGVIFDVNDYDVELFFEHIGLDVTSTAGDFNGDGYADVAVGYNSRACYLIFGNKDILSGDLLEQANVTISLSNGKMVDQLCLLDLNGDGKDDLLLSLYETSSLTNTIYAVFGSSTPPSSIDWKTSAITADLEIQLTWKSNYSTHSKMLKSDFDGNGKDDLVLMYGTNFYLFYGKDSFGSSPVRIDDGSSATRFTGGVINSPSNQTVNINNDDLSDLMIVANSTYHVIFGTTSFVSEWNLSSRPGDVQLNVQSGGSGFIFLGDHFGDGTDDVLFVTPSESLMFVDGSVLTPDLSPIDLWPLLVPINSVPISMSLFEVGDFDGDGKGDIFSSLNDRIVGILADDLFSQFSNTPRSFEFPITYDHLLADVNGDGKSDIIQTNHFFSILGIIYGYDPLDNPTLQAKAAPALPKIQLTSDVEGDPVEMLLSGDFVDAIKDKWVPFNRVVPLTLTATEGEKRITAVFRNSFKRESEMAETTVTLAPGAPGLEVVNNVLSAGKGGARVDCHLDNAAHVTATILDQSGSEIDRVYDGDYGAGIWPLEWDGTNESGRAVGPGVYYMSIEVDGHGEKKKILVQ